MTCVYSLVKMQRTVKPLTREEERTDSYVSWIQTAQVWRFPKQQFSTAQSMGTSVTNSVNGR